MWYSILIIGPWWDESSLVWGSFWFSEVGRWVLLAERMYWREWWHPRFFFIVYNKFSNTFIEELEDMLGEFKVHLAEMQNEMTYL